MQQHNARIGLLLFGAYAACYGAFVLVNALAADWMEAVVFAGLNAAVVSGLALIALALVLSLVYGVAARSTPAPNAALADPPAAE